ncbi:MAG: serine--tRNA ligase [Peptococcaceae bacterium]|nr:serine--tRNA ligase [Peptococcaceae bacterium]
MLDIKMVRSNPESVIAAMKRRDMDLDLSVFLALDEKRRALLTEVEQLKNTRNTVSKQIGMMKKNGENADDLVAEMSKVGETIADLDKQVAEVDAQMEEIILNIPNIPHDSIPDGDESCYRVERTWGEPKQFDFEPLAHWDIGTNLNILDFERAAKVTGARFTFYRGLGARLERAVIAFMLDMHTEKHGYTELIPPYIANRASMTGTGQLPKFAEDMFKLEGLDYFLIPTAEVPVTNYYREEILDHKELPIKHCAFSPCFRAEAGSHGRDTRGIIRQHQFHKVEMVKFAHPDNSFDELEKLTNDAEDVLKALNLPYRVITLPSGDIGFSSCKTYDVEVWLPSYQAYKEISSCSNFVDFQARRANIRFRDENGKVQFVHTLNGSGLAIGRTVAAILENYQQADGSVIIPEVLRPYMGGKEVITK